MDKKTLIILGLILVVVLIFYFSSDLKESVSDNLNSDTGNLATDTISSETTTESNIGISGNVIGGGGSSGSSGSSSGTSTSSSSSTEETPEEKQLPSDIETKECGFYFEEYDVCTGICPEGTCVSEGRSCYCKIV